MLKRKIVKLEGESVFDFLNKFNSDVVEHTALENPKFTNEANVSYLVKDDFGNGYVEVISDDLGKICKPLDITLKKDDLFDVIKKDNVNFLNALQGIIQYNGIDIDNLKKYTIQYNEVEPFIYRVKDVPLNSLSNIKGTFNIFVNKEDFNYIKLHKDDFNGNDYIIHYNDGSNDTFAFLGNSYNESFDINIGNHNVPYNIEKINSNIQLNSTNSKDVTIKIGNIASGMYFGINGLKFFKRYLNYWADNNVTIPDISSKFNLRLNGVSTGVLGIYNDNDIFLQEFDVKTIEDKFDEIEQTSYKTFEFEQNPTNVYKIKSYNQPIKIKFIDDNDEDLNIPLIYQRNNNSVKTVSNDGLIYYNHSDNDNFTFSIEDEYKTGNNSNIVGFEDVNKDVVFNFSLESGVPNNVDKNSLINKANSSPDRTITLRALRYYDDTRVVGKSVNIYNSSANLEIDVYNSQNTIDNIVVNNRGNGTFTVPVDGKFTIKLKENPSPNSYINISLMRMGDNAKFKLNAAEEFVEFNVSDFSGVDAIYINVNEVSNITKELTLTILGADGFEYTIAGPDGLEMKSSEGPSSNITLTQGSQIDIGKFNFRNISNPRHDVILADLSNLGITNGDGTSTFKITDSDNLAIRYEDIVGTENLNVIMVTALSNPNMRRIKINIPEKFEWGINDGPEYKGEAQYTVEAEVPEENLIGQEGKFRFIIKDGVYSEDIVYKATYNNKEHTTSHYWGQDCEIKYSDLLDGIVNEITFSLQ